MSRLGRITTDPEVCHAQPTVRGLRYPVAMLLELLASGMTIDEILDNCADLERDDLLGPWSTERSPLVEVGWFLSGRREVPRRRPAAHAGQRHHAARVDVARLHAEEDERDRAAGA